MKSKIKTIGFENSDDDDVIIENADVIIENDDDMIVNKTKIVTFVVFNKNFMSPLQSVSFLNI